MSKDRVSALCRELDERVDAFGNRSLEGVFPYLWLDAKHLKVRDRGHVRSRALALAYAVHESGHRQVIGIDIGETESEALLARVASIPGRSRPYRCPPRRLRPARRPQNSDPEDPGLPIGSVAPSTSSATCKATAAAQSAASPRPPSKKYFDAPKPGGRQGTAR